MTQLTFEDVSGGGAAPPQSRYVIVRRATAEVLYHSDILGRAQAYMRGNPDRDELQIIDTE